MSYVQAIDPPVDRGRAVTRILLAMGAAAVALVIVALLTAAFLAVQLTLGPWASDYSHVWELITLGFFGPLVYGCGPSAAGALAYAALSERFRLGWTFVISLGAVLGGSVVLLDAALLPFGLAAGPVVAAITHALARSRLDPVRHRRRALLARLDEIRNGRIRTS